MKRNKHFLALNFFRFLSERVDLQTHNFLRTVFGVRSPDWSARLVSPRGEVLSSLWVSYSSNKPPSGLLTSGKKGWHLFARLLIFCSLVFEAKKVFVSLRSALWWSASRSGCAALCGVFNVERSAKSVEVWKGNEDLFTKNIQAQTQMPIKTHQMEQISIFEAWKLNANTHLKNSPESVHKNQEKAWPDWRKNSTNSGQVILEWPSCPSSERTPCFSGQLL